MIKTQRTFMSLALAGVAVLAAATAATADPAPPTVKKINPAVVMPYWDWTQDYDAPVDSILPGE
ncbi:hypothetical protein NRK68_36660 (plasmid) [Streptomyces yangpuensis]|uniref:Chitinase n=1 Tax=Streptomyces yangpuensis TaxID=1648182 RepID=A0ABY5QAY9_9ACTN|nr:hypothetical protein [Streptomyces yangpuensis]UUY52790.1 hypothetical protein NRK68_36660 [Streptomyces yangpuensis]